MINIENLSKAFGSAQVLRSINCFMPEGKITGLAGPNACGKSTLIKSILGLVIPDNGTITIDGRPSNNLDARREMGYMPQHAQYPERLTPREIFRLVSKLKAREPKRQEALVHELGAEEFLDKPCGTLSMGTRQKVSAIAALMCEPRILILDEPTASFDPLAAFTFKRLLSAEAQKGVTVLIVSHIISELAQLIDELFFMVDGNILFQGPVSELEQLSGTSDLELGVINLMRQNRIGRDKLGAT